MRSACIERTNSPGVLSVVAGVSSDPDKVAQYKEMLRFRSSIAHLSDSVAYKNFSRLLLKVIVNH